MSFTGEISSYVKLVWHYRNVLQNFHDSRTCILGRRLMNESVRLLFVGIQLTGYSYIVLAFLHFGCWFVWCELLGHAFYFRSPAISFMGYATRWLLKLHFFFEYFCFWSCWALLFRAPFLGQYLRWLKPPRRKQQERHFWYQWQRADIRYLRKNNEVGKLCFVVKGYLNEVLVAVNIWACYNCLIICRTVQTCQ